jgi:hypothetical protein
VMMGRRKAELTLQPARVRAVKRVPVMVNPSTARASVVLNMAGSSCWMACELLEAVALKFKKVCRNVS